MAGRRCGRNPGNPPSHRLYLKSYLHTRVNLSRIICFAGTRDEHCCWIERKAEERRARDGIDNFSGFSGGFGGVGFGPCFVLHARCVPGPGRCLAEFSARNQFLGAKLYSQRLFPRPGSHVPLRFMDG